MAILYVGDLRAEGTCFHRYRALLELGCEVQALDTSVENAPTRDRSLYARIRRKLGYPVDWAMTNARMVQAVSGSIEVVWIDKGLTVHAETLRAIKAISPNTVIVGYSPDDMYAHHNQSAYFRQHLPLYDMFFTTKSYGVAELNSIGCREVRFVANGYDPTVHRQLELDVETRRIYGSAVGFVGTWEAERQASLEFLASNGIEVRVWGDLWKNRVRSTNRLRIEGRALFGAEYAAAINSTEINLCFLRKMNRDQQTTRSVEIPACGAFMLAERTREHESLFIDGVEAVFFDSDVALLEKVRYYSANPDVRQAIGQAGFARCLRAGYSNCNRMRYMLNCIDEFCNKLRT